jgi:hypothetical protein
VKAGRCILTIVAVLAAIGVAAGLIITYWDKILDAFYAVKEKLAEKKDYFCDCDCDFDPELDCDCVESAF